MSEEIINRLLANLNPGKRVSDEAEKLERLIAIAPSSDIAMIPLISHWKTHGDLLSYDKGKLKGIVENQQQAEKTLSNALRKIVMFEIAGYIGSRYAIELPDDPDTSRIVANMNCAGMDLLAEFSKRPYSEIYDSISEALEKAEEKGIYLPVFGRSESRWLTDAKSAVLACAPDRELNSMDIGFLGRRIFFSVLTAKNQKEINRDPSFAEFQGKYGHLCKQVCGYLLYQSPEIVNHAAPLLNKIELGYITLAPENVTIANKPVLDYCRTLAESYSC